MKRRLTVAALILLVVLVIAFAGVTWYFSSLIVAFQPHTMDEQLAEYGPPSDYGLPQPEDVSIDAGEVSLAGWLFRNDQVPDCGVVLMHGINSSRYNMLKFTPLFWDRGCDLLLYDHRHHGASPGQYGTYGYFEKEDALVALDWFAAQTGLQPSQIGLMGESYGGATALQAAALRPGLAFVAADSSYRDLASIIGEQAAQRFGAVAAPLVPGALALAGLRAGFPPSAVSPMEAAKEIQEPVFLLHSRSDAFTVPSHSSAIFEAIPGARKVLHLTDWGAPHAGSINADFAGYQRYMDDFLDTYVPGFGLEQ